MSQATEDSPTTTNLISICNMAKMLHRELSEHELGLDLAARTFYQSIFRLAMRFKSARSGAIVHSNYALISSFVDCWEIFSRSLHHNCGLIGFACRAHLNNESFAVDFSRHEGTWSSSDFLSFPIDFTRIWKVSFSASATSASDISRVQLGDGTFHCCT